MQLSHALVAACALSIATAAVSQSPTLSPTGLLPGDGTLAAAAGVQQSPDVARGGSQMLAVWEDHRSDLQGGLNPTEGGADIYAARLDANGALLDRIPIVVSQAAGAQTGPRVAWDGIDWLVVWTSQVPTQFFYTTAIHAARVSAAGVLLDATPITIETVQNGSNAELFDVASDGTGWTVFWKDFVGNAWRVRAARVDAQGTLLDPTPVDLFSVSSQPYNGRVVFAQDEFFVVWNHFTATLDDVFGQRIATGLTPIGGAIVVRRSSDYDVHPSVATDGTGFFVVSESYNTCCVGGGGKVFGVRVSHNGNVLDPSGLLLSGTSAITIGRQATATWDSTQWLAVWSYPPQFANQVLFAGRVSPAGAVLDPGGFQVKNPGINQTDPVAGELPAGGSAVLWVDHDAAGLDPQDVLATTVSPSGTPGTAAAIALAAPAQVAPDVTATGSGYTTVFESRVSGAVRVLAERLDAFGTPIEAQPIEVAAPTATLREPHVAFDGSVHLVVWEDTGTIWGRRLDADARPLGATFPIMPGNDPDVAAVAGTFLVVATDTPTSVQIRLPFAARVQASDGSVLDPTPLQLGSSFAQKPAVAAFGGRFLVAWERHFTHDESRANIRAAFVDTSGTTPGDFAVEAPFSQVLVDTAVAADANGALIAWQNQTSPSAGPDVFARQLDPAGNVGSVVNVSTSPNAQSRPALAQDGTRYVAAFQDLRNATSIFDDRKDVFGTRILPNGSVLDPNGLALFERPQPDIQPAVAGQNGADVVVVARFDDLAPHASYRIALRMIDPPSCAGTVTAYGSGCPGSGGVTPVHDVLGCPTPGATIVIGLHDALGGSMAALAFGQQRASLPVVGGCSLLVAPVLAVIPGLPLSPGGAGAGSFSLRLEVPQVPAGGVMLTSQFFVIDPGVPQGFTVSNGVEMVLQ